MKKVKHILKITILVLLILLMNNSVQAALMVPGNNANHWEGTLHVLINQWTVFQSYVNKIEDHYEDYQFVIDYLKQRGFIDDSFTKEEIIDYLKENADSIKVDFSAGKWTVTEDTITRLPPESDDDGSYEGNGDINPDDFRPTEDVYSERLTSMAQTIIGIIQIAGTVISVIIILVIGIKYITGSVEERAEYKTTALLYIIGAVLLFCTVTIIRLVYSISREVFNA